MRPSRSALFLLVLGGLLALPVAGAAGSPAPGSPDPSPLATAAPTPRRATCPSLHGGACLGPLAAGTYTTVAFRTPITYTVPEGWANYEDLPGNFLLIPPGGSNEGVDAGTSDYLGIYRGVAVPAAECERPELIGPSAAEMVDALASLDGLIVSEPEAVQVGGLSGLMVDIGLDPASDGGCVIPGLGRLVPLIIGTGPASLEHAQLEGFTTRLFLLDHGDTNLVIEISDVQTSPGATADHEPIIDSLVFTLE